MVHFLGACLLRLCVRVRACCFNAFVDFVCDVVCGVVGCFVCDSFV